MYLGKTRGLDINPNEVTYYPGPDKPLARGEEDQAQVAQVPVYFHVSLYARRIVLPEHTAIESHGNRNPDGLLRKSDLDPPGL
jgi:hypothetical protein